MIVFRLSKEQWCRDLSGKGAELFGGRWNSKGVPILYTGSSRALAFAEVAVHLPIGIVPKDYFMVSIDVPEKSVMKITESKLPKDWRSNPHSASTQAIGDDFVAKGSHLVLQVPSAVVPGDFNYLINPAHGMMKDVVVLEVVAFPFDERFGMRGTQMTRIRGINTEDNP